MSIKFGGGNYQCACPVCDIELEWPMLAARPEKRIRLTAHQHRENCPAAIVDPALLQRQTYGQAMAEIARLTRTDH